jgi:hypothetical protein
MAILRQIASFESCPNKTKNKNNNNFVTFTCRLQLLVVKMEKSVTLTLYDLPCLQVITGVTRILLLFNILYMYINYKLGLS